MTAPGVRLKPAKNQPHGPFLANKEPFNQKPERNESIFRVISGH
jgi:hypothetical protein